MIGSLRGTALLVDSNCATIEVAGVGYEVLIPESAFTSITPGSEAFLWIRQIIREDDNFLCGFLEIDDRRMFDTLLDVKGCGPKVALALIGQVGSASVFTAIVSGDARTLIKATGVGQRLAERIILETKDKVQPVGNVPLPAAAITVVDELVTALVQLGYRKQDAETVAQKVDQSARIDAQLREALNLLKKG